MKITRKEVAAASTSTVCPYQFRPRTKTSAAGEDKEKIPVGQGKEKSKPETYSNKRAIIIASGLESLHDKTLKTLEEINTEGNTTTPPGCVDHQLTDCVTGYFPEHGTFIMKHEELSIPRELGIPYGLHKLLELTKRDFLSECSSLKRFSILTAIEKEVQKQEALLCEQCDQLIEIVNLQREYLKISPADAPLPEELESLFKKYYGT